MSFPARHHQQPESNKTETMKIYFFSASFPSPPPTTTISGALHASSPNLLYLFTFQSVHMTKFQSGSTETQELDSSLTRHSDSLLPRVSSSTEVIRWLQRHYITWCRTIAWILWTME